MIRSPFDIRNGWRFYQHPAFRQPFDRLTQDVGELRARLETAEFEQHPKTKLLARIVKLLLDDIPRDPNAAEYPLGNTLGSAGRHWRRAKFLQRYRLFFRFQTKAKIIVCAWLNDETTLRKTGATTDPYHVFAQRLASGHPPDDWDALLSES